MIFPWYSHDVPLKNATIFSSKKLLQGLCSSQCVAEGHRFAGGDERRCHGSPDDAWKSREFYHILSTKQGDLTDQQGS